MSESTNHELSERIAVLEERVNTKHAETETAIERLRTDMADWKTDMADWKADWKADMTKRDINIAQRENRQLLATIVIVGVASTILGLLITAQ